MSISILGKNLKEIRTKKGFSAYKLAKVAGIGNSTISEIESGKRQSLNVSTIEKICKVLNITSNELYQIEANVEYVVTDIEQVIDVILSSDELVLDDIELTNNENKQLKTGIKALIEMIRTQREGE